jgi:predicted membrane chloride channel (bestrophin family)
MVADPFEEGQEDKKALDECRAIIEKKTMVQMSLAFAVAVKHYLRGEEGM